MSKILRNTVDTILLISFFKNLNPRLQFFDPIIFNFILKNRATTIQKWYKIIT
jgi:hypothetical protein